MASTKEYLDFVLEQLSDLDEVSFRAMMGESSIPSISTLNIAQAAFPVCVTAAPAFITTT